MLRPRLYNAYITCRPLKDEVYAKGKPADFSDLPVLSDYIDAESHGKNGGDCSKIYGMCPFSIRSLLPKVIISVNSRILRPLYLLLNSLTLLSDIVYSFFRSMFTSRWWQTRSSDGSDLVLTISSVQEMLVLVFCCATHLNLYSLNVP